MSAVVRPKKAPEARRVKHTVRLDPDLEEWLMGKVGVGREFKDFTHAVESAVARMRTAEEGSPAASSRSLTSTKK